MAIPVKIAGTVDAGVRSREPQLYARFKNWFMGRVDDPGEVYANARLALLPTISGHGLSIKTVEALASGLPLIGTSHAFRGMGEGAVTLSGVTIADDAEAFASALRLASQRMSPPATTRATSETRRFYDVNFSFRAYERNLSTLVAPLFEDALSRRETG